jgi:hypothetical protein
MTTMMQFIRSAIVSPKNPWTETDGSWCLKRIFATIAASVMLYKFCMFAGTPDYLSLGGGLSAIFAALAFVNRSEQGDKKDPSHV